MANDSLESGGNSFICKFGAEGFLRCMYTSQLQEMNDFTNCKFS